jgi:hypothetical protein
MKKLVHHSGNPEAKDFILSRIRLEARRSETHRQETDPVINTNIEQRRRETTTTTPDQESTPAVLSPGGFAGAIPAGRFPSCRLYGLRKYKKKIKKMIEAPEA